VKRNVLQTLEFILILEMIIKNVHANFSSNLTIVVDTALSWLYPNPIIVFFILRSTNRKHSPHIRTIVCFNILYFTRSTNKTALSFKVFLNGNKIAKKRTKRIKRSIIRHFRSKTLLLKRPYGCHLPRSIDCTLTTHELRPRSDSS